MALNFTFFPIHQQSDDGIEALHLSVAEDNILAIDFLLRFGLDPNAKLNSHSPLHVAAQLDRVEAAKVLVAHGANFNLLDSRNESPLSLAQKCSSVECCYFLVACTEGMWNVAEAMISLPTWGETTTAATTTISMASLKASLSSPIEEDSEDEHNDGRQTPASRAESSSLTRSSLALDLLVGEVVVKSSPSMTDLASIVMSEETNEDVDGDDVFGWGTTTVDTARKNGPPSRLRKMSDSITESSTPPGSRRISITKAKPPRPPVPANFSGQPLQRNMSDASTIGPKGRLGRSASISVAEPSKNLGFSGRRSVDLSQRPPAPPPPPPIPETIKESE